MLSLRCGVAWLVILAVTVLGASLAAAAPLPTASEGELLAVLRSDAPEADKAITCKFLAVHGSSAAVGDLAALLDNPRLASWARIALEAIPGEEPSAALREAAGRLDGRLLVGVIMSLGVRRDAGAVPILATKLAAEDDDVAAAAAWSLGQIATPEAGDLLAGAMEKAPSPTRLNALARAAILCAANLQAAGHLDAALSLYGLVRSAAVSEQRRAEAIRGTIITQGAAGIPLLIETLRSRIRRLANMAVFTARDLGRGDAADESLAEQVDKALVGELRHAVSSGVHDRATLLIDVLAERNAGDARNEVRAALAEAAESGTKPVRIAAIEALGRSGDAKIVDSVLVFVSDPDPSVADTARTAIAMLADKAVDHEITRRLPTAGMETLPALVDIIGRRRIDAVAEILPLLKHPEADVRIATIEALGSTINLADLDVLVAAAMSSKSEAEAAVARKALREASVRMPDREACAAKLATALSDAPLEGKVMLLDVLAEVGGATALMTVADAGRSGEQALEDAATRLLGKWMTADAAPVLIEIATADPGGKFKTRALRGYLRIARQFVLSEEERAEMCRKALSAAREDADRKAILEILVRYPSEAALRVAESATKTPGLEADANKAVQEIRNKLRPAKKAG